MKENGKNKNKNIRGNESRKKSNEVSMLWHSLHLFRVLKTKPSFHLSSKENSPYKSHQL